MTGVAQFIQTNYTTQDASTYRATIDADMAVVAQTVADFAPTQQGTPNMTVLIGGGSVLSAYAGLTTVDAQNSATITVPTGSNNRIDRIGLNPNSGALIYVEGTPTTGTPAEPAIPSGVLPLCSIGNATAGYLTAATTAITNAMINDERTFIVGLVDPAVNWQVSGSYIGAAVNLPADTNEKISSYYCSVPAGKKLILAHARFAFTGAVHLLISGAANSYTSATASAADETPGTVLCDNSGGSFAAPTYAGVSAYNTTGATISGALQQGDSFWANLILV